jgi:hypothetical protein
VADVHACDRRAKHRLPLGGNREAGTATVGRYEQIERLMLRMAASGGEALGRFLLALDLDDQRLGRVLAEVTAEAALTILDVNHGESPGLRTGGRDSSGTGSPPGQRYVVQSILEPDEFERLSPIFRVGIHSIMIDRLHSCPIMLVRIDPSEVIASFCSFTENDLPKWRRFYIPA